MDIVKKYLTNGQYLTQEYEKLSIFLHHTVSTNAESPWRWWNSTPERVGTAYIIDRDGTIIECYDPKMWAFHIGLSDDDNFWEKHSINIELVSAGWLIPVDSEFKFYPLWPNKMRYTHIPSEEVVELAKTWRGYKYFHKYTDDQLDALKWLIGKLSMDFKTLKLDNDLKSFYEYDENIIKNHISGIWSHSTVRKDKSDIFPFPPLIKALTDVQAEISGAKEGKREPSKTSEAPKSSKKKPKS